MIENIINKISRVTFGVGIIWLFHISGAIGIYWGDTNWFISKSPLNLLISLVLFVWLFSMNTKKKWVFFVLFFLIGMLAEWLGVNYGLLFGQYSYGKNLGLKFDGVPYLIGTYWALLTFITAEIAKILKLKKWSKIVFGAVLMVGLDFLMEKSAPVFDFWEFKGQVPLDNYVAWLAIGIILQTILHYSNIKGNSTISIHLFFAQVLFFGLFYCFPI